MKLEARGPLNAEVSTPRLTPGHSSAIAVSPQAGLVQQRGLGLTGITPPPLVSAMSATAEHSERLQLLAKAFYPVGHPNLHIATRINLDRIGPVGRVDEVGRLKTVGLTMPHAIAGEYLFSPKAKDAPSIDLTRALEDHAALARFYLERGTTVHLLMQADDATEAVYNTDIATAIGNTVVVSSPLQSARILELAAYSGGTRLDPAPRNAIAPVEFGDFLIAQRDGKVYAVQGFGSMRGTPESVDRLARTLKRIAKTQGLQIEHVPIELRGADTLHLDYAVNYAGEGKTRSMIVCPDAIADANDIERLRWIFGAPEDGVFTVSRPEMLEAAANISNFSATETHIADNAHTRATAEFLRSRGIQIHAMPFIMTEKDGSFHCVVGQYYRA